MPTRNTGRSVCSSAPPRLFGPGLFTGISEIALSLSMKHRDVSISGLELLFLWSFYVCFLSRFAISLNMPQQLKSGGSSRQQNWQLLADNLELSLFPDGKWDKVCAALLHFLLWLPGITSVSTAAVRTDVQGSELQSDHSLSSLCVFTKAFLFVCSFVFGKHTKYIPLISMF